MQPNRYLEKAKGQLTLKSIFPLERKDIQIVAILSAEPVLEAYWYKGKQVHLIAIDADGNFFLRQSNGRVKYWVHKTETFIEVAPSIKAFTARLREAHHGLTGGPHA